MTENDGPAIDRSIYVMPMFVNVVVSDLPASEALYAAAGFVTLATIPGPSGVPSLVHLRRERHQDILMTQGVAVRGSVSASFAAGNVDLGDVADRLRSAGAEVAGPTDTPWFTSDVTFTDTDGNTVTLTAPRVADDAAARAWASDQITGHFELPEGTAAPTCNED
ncbi:VOC family protein [Mycetocola reblochoni]|nr:VOC family protein [Mycetocola reblochoni]RLP68640.1 VOC family protein [Mycetocola reblochoni]